ncbi:MAG TPA: PAS domain S-box protein [Longimicrobiaceae bacterium]|nr:PAS domain S-box protein [Longimicrobiaceae bacterium]
MPHEPISEPAAGLLDLMLQAAHEGLALLEDGRLIAVNDALVQLFGVPRERLIGRPPTEFLTPDSREEAERHIREALESPYRARVQHPDGRILEVEVRARALPYRGGTIRAAAVRDVTERTRMEERVRESEARYRDLFESSRDGVFITSIDGTFVAVNAALVEMSGYGRQELLGMNAGELYVDPADRTRFQEALLAKGTVQEFEVPLRTRSGRVVEVVISASVRRDGSGAVVGFQGMLRDVSERKHAERELQDSREHFRTAFEDAPIGMAVMALDGRWLEVNPALARIVGYPREWLAGRRFRELTHPDDLDRDLAAFARLLRGEMSCYQLRKRYLRPDGSPVWALVARSLVRGASGEPLHCIAQVVDVSDAVRAEAELGASTALLRTLVESTADAIFAKDREGRYLLVNQAFAAAMKVEPAVALGRSDEELLPPRSAALYREGDRQVMATGRTATMEETIEVDGVRRTYQALKSPLRAADGAISGVVGISREITERKQMEEELRMLIERYGLVQRATHDVIWDWDWVSGRILWSDSIARMLGYDLAPTMETDLEWFTERVHPDDVAGVMEGLRGALEHDEVWSAEYRFRDSQGGYVTVYDRGYVLRDARGAPVRMIGSMQDVSERCRLIEALEQSEAHYRRLVENAPQPVYAVDLHGRFTEMNRAGVELFGRPHDHLVGKPFASIIAPQDLERAVDAYEQLIHGKVPRVEMECHLLRADGEERLFRLDVAPIRDADSGVITGTHGLARDITEERASQAQMRLFTAALENLEESVNVLGEDGGILYANRAHCRMLGCDPDAHPPEGIIAFAADAEARADLAAALGSVRSAGVWRGAILLRRTDGEAIRVELHMERVDEAGRSVVFSIGRDVTADTARDRRLRRAERLATVGTLVGGVAHELNNPLAAIVGFTQLMLMDEGRTDADLEDLETIRREAQRMAAIVNDLRHLARGTQADAIESEPVDLNDVIRHVVRTRGYTLRTQNIEVHEDLDPDLPAVIGDRGALEQVALNLIVNAEHAIATEDRPGTLVLRTRHSRGGVSFHVIDNGPGIAPAHLERIFDPFFTTKAPGEGTGMGLSLVHGIVGEHGGHIQVDSRVGSGTAFRVDLPAVCAGGDGACGPPEEAHGEAGRSLRVLVVDDEAALRRVITRFLAHRGHEVIQAEDGGAALALLDRHPAGHFDVILSDIRMPGLGGRQLLARLRERGDGLDRRVVFLTGDVSAVVDDRLGPETPVVTKPVDLAVLARAVEEVAAEAARGEAAGA